MAVAVQVETKGEISGFRDSYAFGRNDGKIVWDGVVRSAIAANKKW